MKPPVLVTFFFFFGFVCSNDTIRDICRICGDIVNEYCCQYYNSCCEYISPSGCPSPSSPEARKSCDAPDRCVRGFCSSAKQCCRTALCGHTCVNILNIQKQFD